MLTAGLALAAALAVGGAAHMAVRHRRRFDLRGKVALVTGGSRGLGMILARRLVAAGASVAICARDAEELERAKRDLGPNVAAFAVDVTDAAAVNDMAAAIQARFGAPVDVLLNNAGIIQVGPMETMTADDYKEALRLHFWGPYNTVHAVLPGMRARHSGRIVNISSIGGRVSVPHLLPYSASKFALTGFSEGLRAELLKEGIYVTTVCPGLIRTGSPKNALFKGRHKAEYAWFTLGDSLPGLSMSADACADAILNALIYGDAELTTTLPAKLATIIHGIAPGMVADAFSLVDRFLPGAEGDDSIGTERRLGSESEGKITRSPLTALTRAAEKANNQG